MELDDGAQSKWLRPFSFGFEPFPALKNGRGSRFMWPAEPPSVFEFAGREVRMPEGHLSGHAALHFFIVPAR